MIKIKDVDGNIIGEVVQWAADPGNTITLTIEPRREADLAKLNYRNIDSITIEPKT